MYRDYKQISDTFSSNRYVNDEIKHPRAQELLKWYEDDKENIIHFKSISFGGGASNPSQPCKKFTLLCSLEDQLEIDLQDKSTMNYYVNGYLAFIKNSQLFYMACAKCNKKV